MTTSTVTLKTSDKRSWFKWTKRILIGTLIAIISTVALTILQTTAQAGIGGLLSERMLGRDGVADSSLLLGRTGTSITLSIMGFAPIVSTQPPVSAAGGTTATLRGTVSSMKGQPSATGYFEWGYSAGALTNTTTTIPITGIGNYQKTVTGLTGAAIYYRFVTDADGTSYGTVSSFNVTTSELGNIMLKNLLRVCAAVAILITAIKKSRRGLSELATAILIGIVAFVIVSMIIEVIL